MPWHKKKLVLVLAAQEHFKNELEAAGYDVEWNVARDYKTGVLEYIKKRRSSALSMLAPREYGIYQSFSSAIAGGEFGIPATMHDDGGKGSHFLLTRQEFESFAEGRKRLRMDQFYVYVRKKFGWLVDSKGNPEGGSWSFDTENRRHARGVSPPDVPAHAPDPITETWMKRIEGSTHGFATTAGFDWPVTRAGALREWSHFLKYRAASFGPYEDAMLTGAPFLWHTRIAPALNLGLLSPLELIEDLLKHYKNGGFPLASAEGLLRQVAGWREFIRGVYWLRMPGMRSANLLKGDRPLPSFYWNPAGTEMHCMREALKSVFQSGYAHHIQRLMVLSNYALLMGVRPIDLSHWFWAAFVDAYEWVQLPNVHGMALHADDTFTTKPYAASGAYIDRMSDYCKKCSFDVKKRTGPGACPFNALYWAFLDKHRARFEQNPRVGALYKSWDRFPAAERDAVRAEARRRCAVPEPESAYRFDDDAG